MFKKLKILQLVVAFLLLILSVLKSLSTLSVFKAALSFSIFGVIEHSVSLYQLHALPSLVFTGVQMLVFAIIAIVLISEHYVNVQLYCPLAKKAWNYEWIAAVQEFVDYYCGVYLPYIILIVVYVAVCAIAGAVTYRIYEAEKEEEKKKTTSGDSKV